MIAAATARLEMPLDRRPHVLMALAAGVALGLFSVLADGVIPWRVVTLLGNLASPWVLPAFFLGLLTTSSRRGAAMGGVVLAVGIVTYYGTLVPRGYPLDIVVFAWGLIAFAAGPLLGWCGAQVARNRAPPPVLCVAIPSSLLLGEAAFLVVDGRIWLWNLANEPHRVADVAVLLVLIGVGVALAYRLAGSSEQRLRVAPVALLLTGLGATGLHLGYRVLVAL